MDAHYPPPGQWGPPGPQTPGPRVPGPPTTGRQSGPQQNPQWNWRRNAASFPRPTPPGMLTAVRILVIVPSAVWLFVIGSLWAASHSASESVLGATIQSFVLGLAAGDWVPIVLLPVSGCVLSITMRTGHQVDRWLFTGLGAGWLVWFWLNIHFPLAPSWFTAVLVVLATSFTWAPAMNQWVARVQMWEMDRAGLTPESNGQ